MTTNLTLEQFLKREEQAGDLDSTGEFSVSLEDAIGKMVKYRHADPVFFVLRLLQSAAVVGTRKVKIKTHYKRFSLTFSLDEPGRYGELGPLLKGLTQPDHSQDANGYLAAGLQAAMPFMDLGFEWSHLRGIRKESVLWTPEGCQAMRRFNAHADPNLSEFRFLQTFSTERVSFLKKFLGFLLRGDGGGETLPLLPRITGLPLEVELNSEAVPRLGKEPVPQVLQLAPRKVFDVGFGVQHATENQVYLDKDGQLTSPPSLGGLLRCTHFLKATRPGSGSRIHWMVDGVVLETVEISSETIDFEGWITASGLQTDLSGFKLITNDAHNEKLQQAVHMVKQFLALRSEEHHTNHDDGFRDSDPL